MKDILTIINQIRFKIFLLSTVVPILAVFILGSIAYKYTIDLLSDNEYERISVLARRVDNQLNQSLLEMRLSMSSISSELAQTDLEEPNIEFFLKQHKNKMHPLWKNIYYLSANGSIYQTLDETKPPEETLKKVYLETISSGMDLQAVGPYYLNNKGLILSLSTVVRNGTHIEGIIVTNLDLTKLNESISQINIDQRISMILFNGQQLPLLSDLKISYSQYYDLLPNLKDWLSSSTTEGVLDDTINHTRYLIAGRNIGFNDWFLVFLVDEDSFLAKIKTLKSYTFILALILFIVIALLSLNLANYINKPIHKLIGEMNKIKNGNLKSRIKLKRKDEFLTLANSFNEMLDRIENLIYEKSKIEVMKKQFELKALQSQINPHFLFNTLNSINSLLDLKRTEQIPSIINSLVSLFEYTMDRQPELTDIRSEIQGLQHYVLLQQIRYQNKFRVEYKLDESLLNFEILKLTLQPIVENCIFHGIQGKGSQGVITIGGQYNENSQSLTLFVEDDGSGIPSDRLNKLLEHDLIRPVHSKLKGYNSIGLRNVHERLQLHYGPEFGLRIWSEVGIGTRVDIHLPDNKIESISEVIAHEL